MATTPKTQPKPVPICKRTSQGNKLRPKGKHARKNWKKYRGQG